jgi:hypothetical protein
MRHDSANERAPQPPVCARGNRPVLEPPLSGLRRAWGEPRIARHVIRRAESADRQEFRTEQERPVRANPRHRGEQLRGGNLCGHLRDMAISGTNHPR